MKLSDDLQGLSPESISMSSPSLFWAAEPDGELVRSIKAHGQLQPVLVGQEGRPVLLSGFRRVKALAALGRPVLVRSVEGRLSDFEKGLLYLADNQTRLIDEGMRIDALRYFSKAAGGDLPVEEVAPMLGLKPKSGEMRQCMNWLELPPSYDAHLKAGRIPLAAVRVLSRFDAAALEAVEPFFGGLKWSRSNALNFLTMVYETARARSIRVGDLLEGEGFFSVLGHDLSPKDKIAALIALAHELRMPNLSELEKDFGKSGERLVAGTPWKASQTVNFESGAVDLTVRIGNRDQLEKAVQALRDISASELWERLWSVGGVKK